MVLRTSGRWPWARLRAAGRRLRDPEARAHPEPEGVEARARAGPLVAGGGGLRGARPGRGHCARGREGRLAAVGGGGNPGRSPGRSCAAGPLPWLGERRPPRPRALPLGPPWAPLPGAVVRSGFKRPRRPRAGPKVWAAAAARARGVRQRGRASGAVWGSRARPRGRQAATRTRRRRRDR